MGEQSATRLEGDRYQHLYSWYEILRLLDPESPYEYAYVEHPTAGAADDLTLHPKPGTAAPARFAQVKWHVDLRDLYSFDSLVTATRGEQSLLKRLFESWKRLRGNQNEKIEVWLVSNWAPAPHPDLGSYIDGRSYTLLDAFFSKSSGSLCGQKRKVWQKALGASASELDAFCRDLRFQLSYSSIRTLEEQLDDRMGNCGLRRGENAPSGTPFSMRRWRSASWMAVRGSPANGSRMGRQRNPAIRHAPCVEKKTMSILSHVRRGRVWTHPSPLPVAASSTP